MRPALVLAAGETLGASRADLLPAAAAWECVHTYSLVHDDLPCMDDDDLRRGRDALHRAFGVEVAVRAGAFLLASAFELVAASPRAGEEVRDVLARAAGELGMVGGQALDILGEGRDDLGYDDLVEIHRRKTAALIAGAVEAGGVIAGASAERRALLRAAGEAAGLAFQIADDILDAVSTPEAMGKPTRSDAMKGKRTYPGLLGVAEARARAQASRDEALAALSRAGVEDGPLPALFDFMVERTK